MNKSEAAGALFDAIGNISDEVIAECERPPRKKSTFFIGALAACVALALTVGALRWSLNFSREESLTGLDAVLIAAKELVPQKSAEQLADISSAALIWQPVGEDGYYVYTLEESELKRLDGRLEKEQTLAARNADEPTVRLWISYGNGRIVTPYLPKTNGNIGICEPFEYSAEIIPSDDLVALVGSILPV